MTHHGLDSDTQVLFYDNEFYCLSNFAAFAVEENGILYMTSEHLYHSKKFDNPDIQKEIREARSAHDSQIIAKKYKPQRKANWNEIKAGVMKEVLLLKINQHPYVLKKLLDTGTREMIENSWRDAYWGWGENKDGQNMLGKIWMEIRDEMQK